jgi:MinD-like ATPase involved in chromosome partitioning or flagellar assembly
VITLAGDPEEEAEVARALADRSDVELVLRCVDRVELLASVRGGDIDALISVGAPTWFDRQGAEEARNAAVRIVGVVTGTVDADRLASFGAALVPFGTTVEELVDRCTSAHAEVPTLAALQPSVPKGKVIGVWGPKGAPGRTTVAIELAHELALVDANTLLLDGDPYGGDVVQALGVVEELPTVIWAARMAAKEELDAARLALDLRRIGRSGPVFIPGLPRPELWAEVSEFGWRQLLLVARAAYENTVIDVGFCLETEGNGFGPTGQGRNRMTRDAIGASDRVVAVCRADPVGVKNFLWSFDELTELVDRESIVVVVNRVARGDERELGDLLRKHIDKRPIAYVPDRPDDLRRASLAGLAVRESMPGSDVSTSFRSIAAALGAELEPAGLLSRMLGRS